jgi:hypothetical protein
VAFLLGAVILRCGPVSAMKIVKVSDLVARVTSVAVLVLVPSDTSALGSVASSFALCNTSAILRSFRLSVDSTSDFPPAVGVGMATIPRGLGLHIQRSDLVMRGCLPELKGRRLADHLNG